MGTDPTQLTSEEAREQIAASQSRSLRSGKDHVIHAAGTAVFGLGLGFFTGMRSMASGASSVALAAAFAAVLIAQVIWVERAARTVPRGARMWSRLGIGTSLVVALTLALPWLNLQAQTEPTTWPMALVAALVVAVPSLVGAAVIAGKRQ